MSSVIVFPTQDVAVVYPDYPSPESSSSSTVLSLPAATSDPVTWIEALTETAVAVSLDTPATVESPSWSA